MSEKIEKQSKLFKAKNSKISELTGKIRKCANRKLKYPSYMNVHP